jgi:hypothetical protein
MKVIDFMTHRLVTDYPIQEVILCGVSVFALLALFWISAYTFVMFFGEVWNDRLSISKNNMDCKTKNLLSDSLGSIAVLVCYIIFTELFVGTGIPWFIFRLVLGCIAMVTLGKFLGFKISFSKNNKEKI